MLPGDEFVLVSVASRIDDAARPGRVDASPRKLDCGNDSQDHTLLPYASAPFVMRDAPRSQSLKEPPRDCLPRRRRPRPPHPDPRFVTTANRPFHRVGTNHLYDNSEFGKRELFSWQRLAPQLGDLPARNTICWGSTGLTCPFGAMAERRRRWASRQKRPSRHAEWPRFTRLLWTLGARQAKAPVVLSKLVETIA